MSVIHRLVAMAATAALSLGAGFAMSASASASASPSTFIGQFSHLKTIASTVPGNGDVNPYGVAVVGLNRGRLHRGDILVSNFNNKANLQGTGTTIVQVSPGGRQTLFARITRSDLTGRCPGGVGLTTALGVLRGGWVVVGSTPSKNGMAATAKAGCLIVLDSNGIVRETISGNGINGPWDMAVLRKGLNADLFVTNVLNGTVAAKGAVVDKGTVLRLLVRTYWNSPPKLLAVTTIGSGFSEQTNASAFIIGPTGVGLDSNGTLYVADTGENRITGIPYAATRTWSAGTGFVLTSGGRLNAPLGLAIAPNGDVLTVNGGDGRIVETSTAGVQVAHRFLDRSGSPPGSGALFGLAVAPRDGGVYYVDDATNTLRLLH
jgi:NHL repeat-containing protein